MTASRLRTIAILTVAAVAVYAAAAAVAYSKHSALALYFKDFIPVIVGIAVAILAAAFQRRVSYLQALRDLWKQLLPAIQTVIQYTHLESPTVQKFAEAYVSLATAIDAVRGVFRNVPHHGKLLYPYENLHDIRKVLDSIAPFPANIHNTPAQREKARKVIVSLWKETHAAMLLEFDCAVPQKPVSKYLTEKGGNIADDYLDEIKPPPPKSD